MPPRVPRPRAKTPPQRSLPLAHHALSLQLATRRARVGLLAEAARHARLAYSPRRLLLSFAC